MDLHVLTMSFYTPIPFYFITAFVGRVTGGVGRAGATRIGCQDS